jgi:hypothetical protein
MELSTIKFCWLLTVPFPHRWQFNQCMQVDAMRKCNKREVPDGNFCCLWTSVDKQHTSVHSGCACSLIRFLVSPGARHVGWRADRTHYLSVNQVWRFHQLALLLQTLCASTLGLVLPARRPLTGQKMETASPEKKRELFGCWRAHATFVSNHFHCLAFVGVFNAGKILFRYFCTGCASPP